MSTWPFFLWFSSSFCDEVAAMLVLAMCVERDDVVHWAVQHKTRWFYFIDVENYLIHKHCMCTSWHNSNRIQNVLWSPPIDYCTTSFWKNLWIDLLNVIGLNESNVLWWKEPFLYVRGVRFCLIRPTASENWDLKWVFPKSCFCVSACSPCPSDTEAN